MTSKPDKTPETPDDNDQEQVKIPEAQLSDEVMAFLREASKGLGGSGTPSSFMIDPEWKKLITSVRTFVERTAAIYVFMAIQRDAMISAGISPEIADQAQLENIARYNKVVLRWVMGVIFNDGVDLDNLD